jgi:hypothetical protein
MKRKYSRNGRKILKHVEIKTNSEVFDKVKIVNKEIIIIE